VKDSYLMLYLLIPIVEFLLFLLILIGGFRVYKLYSISNVRPKKPEIEETINNEASENRSAPKKINAALDDYIDDFF